MAKNTPPADGKLADVNDSGEAVASRGGSAANVLQICERMVRDNKTRADRMQKVQGSFDGNAPKNHAALVKANRANDSNLNFKRVRGHIMNAWTPFFDMVCEVPVCVDGDIQVGDSAQSMELMRGFAQYFHEMQFNWRGFDDMSQLCDLQMLLHGPGILTWEDKWNWQPRTILAGNFYVPQGTTASLDNCERALFWTPMTAGDLWRKNADGKQIGWNVEAVKRAIMDSAKQGSALRNCNWMDWQRAFKNGDQFVSSEQTNTIGLYTLFVQEMDGTISQKIVPAKPQGKNGTQFLFESPDNYESWDQAICLFPYDIGSDGTYHSIKGLGTDILPFCSMLDAIDNSVADLVISSIKPMWQPSTNADMSKFKMGKWGGGNFIPKDINPLQVDISRGIEPALEVSRGFSQTLSANTAAANLQDLAAPTVEETAKSAMIRAAERAKVSKGLHNRYMRGKDRQYAETWRRASNPDLRSYHPGAKEALKFQRRCRRLCEKLGLPWEQQLSAKDSPTGEAGKFTALQLVENIRANRSLGLGSPAMRIEIVSQLMANIDRFDEIGQAEIKRQFVAVMTSYQNVDAIAPSLTTGRDKTNDEAVAAQENNAMSILGTGAEVVVTPAQDHVLHLQTHLPSAEKDVQDCQQGLLDPRQCFDRLEAKGRHSSEHLAVLEGNPTRQGEAKEFSARLAEVASYSDHLQQTIAEQDQAAANQPQPGEISPEMAKVQGALEIKREKEQGTMALKADKQQFDQAMKLQQAEFQRALDAQKVGFEQRLADLEAASGIQRENAKAAAQPKPAQPQE